jgi:hypothetical protein
MDPRVAEKYGLIDESEYWEGQNEDDEPEENPPHDNPPNEMA